MKKELTLLSIGAVALVVNATVVLTGLAIIDGFMDSGRIDNTTAGYYSAGLGILGGFIGLICLVMIGAVLIGMVKGYMKGM